MRTETRAERAQFYAIATWAVPVFAVLIPFVLVSLLSTAGRPLVVSAALLLLVGGGLVARFGRSAWAGLFVGAVLGLFVAMGGLLGAV